MELQSINGLISFGKEFYNLKDELQPSNQVITSQILAQTFPFKLSINLDKELKLENYNLQEIYNTISIIKYYTSGSSFSLKYSFDTSSIILSCISSISQSLRVVISFLLFPSK